MVHPHGCGELADCHVKGQVFDGSSPRVWGTPAHAPGERSLPRFIPTGVGNSCVMWMHGTRSSVHPHGCGELSDGLCFLPTYQGSSPRVWGTPLRSCCFLPESWFIPTGVGNSRGPGTGSLLCSVHPHGCGELFTGHTLSVCVAGSSPRVWGTLLLRKKPAVVLWFIPTGVGNSNEGKVAVPKGLVHPHGCGELVIQHDVDIP